VEARLAPEVPGFLLVDGDGGEMPVDPPEGLGDEVLKGLAWAEPGGQYAVVPAPQTVVAL
jgi:hypothetical protein